MEKVASDTYRTIEMKKVILFVLSVLIAQTLVAQDIIVTRKSERIDAKIIRISETEVEYKKYNNQEGPVFVIPCEKIASVIFANGDVQTFDKTTVSNESNIKESGHEQKSFCPPQNNHRYSLLLGYNRPSLTASYSNGYNASVDLHGLYLGFGHSVHINNYLLFQPRYIISIAWKDNEHMLDFKIPLLVRVGIDSGEDDFGLYAFVGPQLLIGLSAGNEFSLNDYPEGMNRFDIGITLGAGIRVSRVCFDIAYTFGLLDKNASGSSGQSVYLNHFTLGTSFLF